MPPPDSPALPAIRERVQAWQAQSDAIPGAAWPDRLVRVMLEDLEAVLALVARLQGEREALRLALDNTSLQRLDDASPCWCPSVREYADSARVEHVPWCRAARAALGEEE